MTFWLATQAVPLPQGGDGLDQIEVARQAGESSPQPVEQPGLGLVGVAST